ncbi:MAG: amino acid ABC transporter substrate-binding protein [Anaerolineales bacterium]|nr:amino acid ABC transporter substrate-binding protein [Anaerolineales bacterium]
MKRLSPMLMTMALVLSVLLAACQSAPPATQAPPAATATQPPAATEEVAEPTQAAVTEAPTEAAATAEATAEATEAPAATEEAAAPASDGPIRIGVSLPLSGRFSEPGTAAKQGYEVWAAMVNEAGGLLGRPVELTVLDNASDQDTAVSDYEKMITVDKVDLVVGPFSSFLVIPTSEVAARYGYAFVEPAGGAPDVFNRGLTNLFFAQPAPSAQQAVPFADYILSLPEDVRPKTFAVASQDDPFVIGVMDNLKKLLTEGGLELVFDEIYAPETTDFSTIAIQVADLNPDLMVGGTQAEDSIAQIRAYQEAGYEPRFAYYTTGPSLPGPFKEALGDATEGIFASISWFPEAEEHQNAEFVAKYIEMFGGEAGGIAEDAANAFTVGQVLQQAVENIQSVDNAELIEELHKGTFETVVGPLSFDEKGIPQGSYMLLQWQGDKFVIVGPQDRAQAEAVPPAGWSTDAAAEATEAPAASGEPIRIGASLPLSGRFSEPGTAAKQGYETWVDMVNASGGILGRPVELSVVDNASDQDTAVADYEKLITVDKVDLVVGPFSSFLVIPTSEVAARYGYAFVEPAGGSPEVFNRGLNNIFFAQPARGSEQAVPFADYLLALPEDQKPKTFAVVSQDDPFTLGVMEQLKGLLTEGDMELVFDEIYAPETTDFSSIATQVADLDPDLIVGGTVLEDSIGQVRAYQEAGYQPRFAYFTTGPSLPGPFREALGDATEGIFASISWFPEAEEPQNAEFVAKYVEMFGGTAADIPEDAANAFTVGQVLQQAAENIQSIDNAELIDEIHQATFQTVVGPLSFDEVGAPQGSFMLLQWQGDKFVIVGPEGRAQAEALPPPKPEW